MSLFDPLWAQGDQGAHYLSAHGVGQYPRARHRWRPMILAAFAGPAVTVGLVIVLRRHWNMATPAFLIGLLSAVSYAYAFARTVPLEMGHSLGVGARLGSIAVLPADVVGRSWQGAFILIMMLYGAVLLVSGGISFWLYLRYTEAPAPEAQ